MKLRWVCLKLLKKICFYFEYDSELPSKLCNLIWLYLNLMDIDKSLEDLNLKISYFKEMMEEV